MQCDSFRASPALSGSTTVAMCRGQCERFWRCRCGEGGHWGFSSSRRNSASCPAEPFARLRRTSPGVPKQRMYVSWSHRALPVSNTLRRCRHQCKGLLFTTSALVSAPALENKPCGKPRRQQSFALVNRTPIILQTMEFWKIVSIHQNSTIHLSWP